MLIRNVSSGTLADVADDKAEALIAQGTWEAATTAAVGAAEGKRTTARKGTTVRKGTSRQKET